MVWVGDAVKEMLGLTVRVVGNDMVQERIELRVGGNVVEVDSDNSLVVVSSRDNWVVAEGKSGGLAVVVVGKWGNTVAGEPWE